MQQPSRMSLAKTKDWEGPFQARPAPSLHSTDATNHKRQDLSESIAKPNSDKGSEFAPFSTSSVSSLQPATDLRIRRGGGLRSAQLFSPPFWPCWSRTLVFTSPQGSVSMVIARMDLRQERLRLILSLSPLRSPSVLWFPPCAPPKRGCSRD